MDMFTVEECESACAIKHKIDKATFMHYIMDNSEDCKSVWARSLCSLFTSILFSRKNKSTVR